jgi:hypothetical protein
VTTFFGVLGFTQYGNLPLMQFASVTGMIGITFLLGHGLPGRSWPHVQLRRALLLTLVLERRFKEAGVDLSAEQALQALSTIRMVSFKVGASTSRIGVSVVSARARQVL